MALVKCKECGNQVSTKAKACPSCGVKPVKPPSVLGWIFIAVVVFSVAFNMYSGSKTTSTAEPSKAVVKSKSDANVVQANSSGWLKDVSIDKLTDEKFNIYALQSKNSVKFDFPYNQAGGSRLTIAFRKSDKNLNAYLVIDKGQMLCNPSECGFDLRISDGKVQNWSGVPPSTHESNIMFINDARRFESVIKQGKPIRIGIEFYHSGIQVFEFDTNGFPGM